MTNKVILLCLLGFAYLALKCPKFEQKDLGDFCAQRKYEGEDVKYYVNPCKDKDKPVCNLQFSLEGDACAETLGIPIRYPGEYCENDDQCMSKTCKDNKCVGLEKDQACQYSEDCAAGLFCHFNGTNSTCVEANPEKQNCTDGWLCKAGLVCNNTKCVGIGSIQIGEAADNKAACASLTIYKGKCASPFKLDRTDDKKGPYYTDNDVCTYNNDKYQISIPAVCGRGQSDRLVCQVGAGDVDIDDYLNYVKPKSELDDEDSECHVSKGPLCMKKKLDDLSEEYLKAYIAYEKLMRWNWYFDNPLYIIKVVNQEYYMFVDQLAKKEEEEESQFGLYLFLGIAIGAVVIIAIILIIIYFRRKKGEEGEEEQTTET